MRKDKEKVLDEVWTEDRVKSFLDVKSYDEVEEDFHMLPEHAGGGLREVRQCLCRRRAQCECPGP